jgi:propanediol dehydratase small subunit
VGGTSVGAPAGASVAGASVAATSVAGASVAATGFSVAAAPPHAVRTIDAMIKRDITYKSFFMVIFSPHKDLDWTEVFKGKK